MKSPMPEFENASPWAGSFVSNSWTPYIVVSQLAMDKSIKKDQIFGLKGGGRSRG